LHKNHNVFPVINLSIPVELGREKTRGVFRNRIMVLGAGHPKQRENQGGVVQEDPSDADASWASP
jgi:hypothetical protein